jgi:hypothetical protein
MNVKEYKESGPAGGRGGAASRPGGLAPLPPGSREDRVRAPARAGIINV